MIFRKSIRWRLQMWHGALLCAMVIVFCVTAYRLEKANALRHFDQELSTRLASMTNALEQGGGGGGGREGRRRPRPDEASDPGQRPVGAPFDEEAEPRGPGRGPRPPREGPEGGPGERPPDGPPPGDGPPDGANRPPPLAFRSGEMANLFPVESTASEPFYFQVWTRQQTLLTRSAAAPEAIPLPAVPGEGSREQPTRQRGELRELYHFTPPGECLLVGRSLAGVQREMRDFGWKLGGLGAAVLAAGLAGGWWITTRALKPIADISSAATRIAAGHLDERIHTAETESELGKLATLLDETFQRLDAAFAEQSRFTSDAAHELRTPVTIILAQSQLALSRERSNEALKETIEISQRAAKRMQGLIEAMLQLAVLDAAAEQAPELEPWDLATLAREGLPLIKALAAEKEITLKLEATPAPCRANADQIAQVITNLLSNAVKFSPAGTTVTLRTGMKDGRACLAVQDQGPGIPVEHQAHLFERFYRADSSRSRASGGAGLGLAICKRIADAHGGTLTVESMAGEGSTFTLTLPMERGG